MIFPAITTLASITGWIRTDAAPLPTADPGAPLTDLRLARVGTFSGYG